MYRTPFSQNTLSDAAYLDEALAAYEAKLKQIAVERRRIQAIANAGISVGNNAGPTLADLQIDDRFMVAVVR